MSAYPDDLTPNDAFEILYDSDWYGWLIDAEAAKCDHKSVTTLGNSVSICDHCCKVLGDESIS